MGSRGTVVDKKPTDIMEWTYTTRAAFFASLPYLWEATNDSLLRQFRKFYQGNSTMVAADTSRAISDIHDQIAEHGRFKDTITSLSELGAEPLGAQGQAGNITTMYSVAETLVMTALHVMEKATPDSHAAIKTTLAHLAYQIGTLRKQGTPSQRREVDQ